MSLHVKTLSQVAAMIRSSAPKSQDRIVQRVYTSTSLAGLSMSREDLLDDCRFLASRFAMQDEDGLELYPTDYQPEDTGIIHFGRQDGLESMPVDGEKQAAFDAATAPARFTPVISPPHDNDAAKRMASAAGYGPNAQQRNT